MRSTEPIQNGYERRKNRKREQILCAAVELFKEKGFSHVSVSGIAERAGVSQVTIYNHFRDKYHLVEAAVLRIAQEKIEEYRGILFSDAPWMERLRTAILDKRKSLRDFRGELLDTLYREYPELLKELRDRELRAREAITYPFLDEGRRLGHVPRDISNEAVAAYLQVVMRGFDESPDVLQRVAEAPELFDQIYDLITYGLVWEKAGPSR